MVHDAASALDAYEVFNPGILLLDISLPDMNGYELARAVRALRPSSAFTLVSSSAWARERDTSCAYEAGFEQHLFEPMTSSAIRACVDARSESQPQDGSSSDRCFCASA